MAIHQEKGKCSRCCGVDKFCNSVPVFAVSSTYHFLLVLDMWKAFRQSAGSMICDSKFITTWYQ